MQPLLRAKRMPSERKRQWQAPRRLPAALAAGQAEALHPLLQLRPPHPSSHQPQCLHLKSRRHCRRRLPLQRRWQQARACGWQLLQHRCCCCPQWGNRVLQQAQPSAVPAQAPMRQQMQLMLHLHLCCLC